jgi:hypothetical protein
MAGTVSVNGVSRIQVLATPLESTATGVAVRTPTKAGTELSPLFRLLPPHLRQTIVESVLLILSSSVTEPVSAVQVF